jgi:hypothetical protein
MIAPAIGKTYYIWMSCPSKTPNVESKNMLGNSMGNAINGDILKSVKTNA